MNKYDYDVIAIGAGGAGATVAKLAAGIGKKSLLVDRAKFGGECTWSGCIPSKSLLHSAKGAYQLSQLDHYSLKGKPLLDTRSVLNGVKDIISDVYTEHLPSVFKKLGIDSLENSEVSFFDQHTILIKGKKITSDKIVITTGTSPFVPPIEGLDTITYYTNETIFSLKKIPKSMIVMGGGAIGIELAQAFSRLGTKVIVIEMFNQILFREDVELTALLREELQGEKIEIITGAKAVMVSGKKNIKLTYEKENQNKTVSAELLLVATGRQPNIEELNLEKVGVKFSRKGIEVNSLMQTSVSNIYAAGDVVGPYQFSHMAGLQGQIAGINALLPFRKKIDYKHIPWVTFSDPELARSGLTEAEALDSFGKSIQVFRSFYKNLDRARTERVSRGMLKIICNRRGYILGAHMLGERSGEVIHEVHLAKSLGIPLYKLNSVIHAYPTYSELVKAVAQQAYIARIQNNPLVKLLKFFRRK